MYNVFAEFYDRLTDDVDYKSAARFVDNAAKEYNLTGGILLDLACGTGSLALEMAGLGYDVIGVDASENMLSQAVKKNTSGSPGVLYLCQRAEELDLYGTVDITVCMLDSLNHLSNDAKLVKVFSRVALFSNPGALFIFDVNTLRKHRELLGDNAFVFDKDDVYCVWQNSFNEDDCSVEIALDFFVRSGKQYTRATECFTEVYFSDEQIMVALEKAGFELLNRYGDYNSVPVDDTSERIVYVAKKRVP